MPKHKWGTHGYMYTHHTHTFPEMHFNGPTGDTKWRGRGQWRAEGECFSPTRAKPRSNATSAVARCSWLTTEVWILCIFKRSDLHTGFFPFLPTTESTPPRKKCICAPGREAPGRAARSLRPAAPQGGQHRTCLLPPPSFLTGDCTWKWQRSLFSWVRSRWCSWDQICSEK